jgi:hypothetical protein
MAMQDALAERDGHEIRIYWTGGDWCAEVNTAGRDRYQHLADTPLKAIASALSQVGDDVTR